MATTLLGSSFNTTSGTHTVTATPAVGDLIVIIVANTGSTSQVSPTDNNSSGTYDLVTGVAKASAADRMSVFIRRTLVGSASSTVFTAASGTTSGGGLAVYKITGALAPGLAALRQYAYQENQATSTPAPTFSTAVLTGNAVISAVFNATNPAGLTVRTGYTSDVNTGYATPTTGFMSIHRDSGETSTAMTWGSSSSAFGSVAIEIFTTTPTTPYIKQATTFISTSATDTTMILPSAPTAGNLLIYFGDHYVLYNDWTDPAGWTPISGTNPHNFGGPDASAVAVYRVVQSGDSATQTFHHVNTADYISGILIEVTGQGTSWLNQVAYTDSSGGNNTPTALTPSVLGTLAIAFATTDSSTGDDYVEFGSGWAHKARRMLVAGYHPAYLGQRINLTSSTVTGINPTISGLDSSVNTSLQILIAPPVAGTTNSGFFAFM